MRKPPKKEIIESLRDKFPHGSRVELILMDDKQAPPVGTLGTVYGVDAMGTIHVNWDNGCGLGIVYGVDECRRIDAEPSPQACDGAEKEDNT